MTSGSNGRLSDKGGDKNQCERTAPLNREQAGRACLFSCGGREAIVLQEIEARFTSESLPPLFKAPSLTPAMPRCRLSPCLFQTKSHKPPCVLNMPIFLRRGSPAQQFRAAAGGRVGKRSQT